MHDLVDHHCIGRTTAYDIVYRVVNAVAACSNSALDCAWPQGGGIAAGRAVPEAKHKRCPHEMPWSHGRFVHSPYSAIREGVPVPGQGLLWAQERIRQELSGDFWENMPSVV